MIQRRGWICRRFTDLQCWFAGTLIPQLALEAAFSWHSGSSIWVAFSRFYKASNVLRIEHVLGKAHIHLIYPTTSPPSL